MMHLSFEGRFRHIDLTIVKSEELAVDKFAATDEYDGVVGGRKSSVEKRRITQMN